MLLTSNVSAQVIIKEKVEINPQQVIISDAPLSNHTIRVDMQWSPASLPGWIRYYDLNCDQNNYSSSATTTGTNTYSLTSPGYENYQIQLSFGYLDPNQQTVTGTYQLYYDEQLIRSESFQAQPASYSNFAYFNIHYQSPVLTDYTFSIYTSEICPGWYEDIYLTTSRNCNATAEINTELDSIILTIETGREFVSFYKNNQISDTVIFMYDELNSVHLRQDSLYSGTTSFDVNIKSDWIGIIKNQQLVINPQEQIQIRVPDQPIIVFSGGVGALMIETFSSSICPPYISENLRYTALIKKNSKRGLLYDYDTDISGDTLTNLTPQEDGEKYLGFITEGEILDEADTALLKIFANDENIDTTEAIIIIYPNEISVQINPPVISQGDTAVVVLKKRGIHGLEEFAADKLFNVEIVQGQEYGLILDSLSNDTLTSFSDIPQGFKIIAQDSTDIDSTRIRIKVSTEESGFPASRITMNKTKTNKKEVVDDNENQKSDDAIIAPDWIIPGEPILLEGFGDVIVKQDEWCEDLDECDEIEFPDIELNVHENNWQNLNVCADSTFIAGTAFLTSDNSYYREDFDIELCKEEGSDKIHFSFDDDIVINCVSDFCIGNIGADDFVISDVYSFPGNMACDWKIFWLKQHKIYPMPTANIIHKHGVLQSVYVIRDIWERHEEEHRNNFLMVAEGFKAEYLIKIKETIKQCSDFSSEEDAQSDFKQAAEKIIKQFYNAVKNEDDRISNGGDDGDDIMAFERRIHKIVIDDYLQDLIDYWEASICGQLY